MSSQKNLIETLLGAVILIVAGYFFTVAYQSSHTSVDKAFVVTALFDRIDGLVEGNDVRVSGGKVGFVSKIGLDENSLQAKVSLSIDNNVKIPSDSSAIVSSESFFGGKYISLQVGGDDDRLKDGDVIELTQSALNFEQMIGQFLFSQKDKK